MPVVVVVTQALRGREALDRRRVREQERVDEARRIEVREVRLRQPAERRVEGAGVVRQLEREPVRAPLEPSRERRGQRQRHELEQSPDEQQQRNVPRRRVERPRDEHRDRRARHREHRSLRDVAVPPVPELVRDDDLELGLVRLGEQRVVHDDAPRAADPGDVGVVLARPPARVRDEHLAHGHAGAVGERAQRAGELAVAQRLEAVEHRLEHEGATNTSSSTSTHAPRTATSGHHVGNRCDRPDQREHCRGREHRADRKALHVIERPARPGLRREPPAALAQRSRARTRAAAARRRERPARAP